MVTIFYCQDRDSASRKGSFDSMPFPPGVGGGRAVGDANIESYEVITAEKAIDESNVGNKMLRNMGWHEGLVSYPSFALEDYSKFLAYLTNFTSRNKSQISQLLKVEFNSCTIIRNLTS